MCGEQPRSYAGAMVRRVNNTRDTAKESSGHRSTSELLHSRKLVRRPNYYYYSARLFRDDNDCKKSFLCARLRGQMSVLRDRAHAKET